MRTLASWQLSGLERLLKGAPAEARIYIHRMNGLPFRSQSTAWPRYKDDVGGGVNLPARLAVPCPLSPVSCTYCTYAGRWSSEKLQAPSSSTPTMELTPGS